MKGLSMRKPLTHEHKVCAVLLVPGDRGSKMSHVYQQIQGCDCRDYIAISRLYNDMVHHSIVPHRLVV